jgi:O-antigen ligase
MLSPKNSGKEVQVAVPRWLLALVLLLPWLNPFTAGPTPSVLPWLVSAACAVLVWQFRAVLSTQTVATTWLIAALGSALMGILQYFGQTQTLSPWVHATDFGEAFANLRQRNQFATLTSIGLLALLWYVARWRDWNEGGAAAQRVGLLRLLPWIALLGLGNAASGSRTGLMQWVLIAGLTVLWSSPGEWRRAVVGTSALAVYLLAALALPQALEFVTGLRGGGVMARFQEEAGCSSRRVLWANVLHLIAQKPWLGWGWGELGYAHFTTLYPGERFCEILDNAHNLPLHLAVTLGVPAAVALCGTGLWLVWRAAPWRETDATRQLAWGVLAVILLHSLLEYPLWYGPFQIAAGLCVWLLCTREDQAAPTDEEKRPLALILTGFIATLFIAILSYAAWDYHRVSEIYLPTKMRTVAYRDDTLNKIRDSWLFRNQVDFAELTTTTLVPDNAAKVNTLAHQVLHFSPEARVAEALIESAVMLGRNDEALFYLQRLQAAFPAEHTRWAKAKGG